MSLSNIFVSDVAVTPQEEYVDISHKVDGVRENVFLPDFDELPEYTLDLGEVDDWHMAAGVAKIHAPQNTEPVFSVQFESENGAIFKFYGQRDLFDSEVQDTVENSTLTTFEDAIAVFTVSEQGDEKILGTLLYLLEL